MENYSGKKVNTCVFISGNGSNLKSILKSSRDYNFPIKIELIVSNNIKAKGIDFAKKFNGKLDYWYDGVHTSALGSKAIAEVIIEDLIKIIKNETN